MSEVSALPRHTPTEPKKDISTLLKHGLIILVTTLGVGAAQSKLGCNKSPILLESKENEG